MFADIIPVEMSKIEKNPDRPKNLDSKEEKQLTNLSQNDLRKNSDQLFWHLNPEEVVPQIKYEEY